MHDWRKNRRQQDSGDIELARDANHVAPILHDTLLDLSPVHALCSQPAILTRLLISGAIAVITRAKHSH